METFKTLVEAVEENNRMNDGSWKDWENAEHIESVYGKLAEDYACIERAFLNAMIREYGDARCQNAFLDAMECLNYGQSFSRGKKIIY